MPVQSAEPEFTYRYPKAWEAEFRASRRVQEWLDNFPWLFDKTRGVISWSTSPKTNLADFSTYALMYLLRRDEGFESLTYFRLCSTNKKKDPYIEQIHTCLRQWMGSDTFERLCAAVRAAGITAQGFQGEPDLFCWNEATSSWFFAEAKGNDRLRDSQRKWFAVCRQTIPDVTIKVCRLKPLAAKHS